MSRHAFPENTPMPADTAAAVLAYHEHSKHRPERYAPGPETLDWDAQPDPFRRFAGAPMVPLPLPAENDKTAWTSLFRPGEIAARRVTRESLGLLFELSFALSAWKQVGPDRWALRCNPSSGNLHPTEVYLIARGLPDLSDGLYHYAPKEHALERRALYEKTVPKSCIPRMLVGFSSIHWREAWKYGERAFRYCQLDMGHAIGALRYACAVLGRGIQEVGLDHAALAALLGLDRAEDFEGAEREEPEALFELQHPLAERAEGLTEWADGAVWSGHANRLDPRPMYRCPLIDEVAQASRRSKRSLPATVPLGARRLLPHTDRTAAALILARRSAQGFDRRARLDIQRFWPMLGALMPRTEDDRAPVPWDISPA